MIKEIQNNLEKISIAQKELQVISEKEGNGRFVHKLCGISGNILNSVSNIRSWLDIGISKE